MKDLYCVRPDYETRGDDNPTMYPDAHRFVRMVLSVGGILDVPFEIIVPAVTRTIGRTHSLGRGRARTRARPRAARNRPSAVVTGCFT